jgi:hypothetical protein
MRSNSLFSLVFASILVAASAASTFAQTTYTVVPAARQTTYSVVSVAPAASLAPVTSVEPATVEPAPKKVAKPQKPEVTTFGPSDENPCTNTFQAMYRVDAFTVLSQALAIESRATQPTMTADEFSLFQDLRDGRGNQFSFAEAALIVSGVHDAAKRKQYLGQIDQIAADAKDAVAKANHKTIRARAHDLIRFLLDGPMKAGYVSGQDKLGAVLDTGHYNCVSSALMFAIIAHRLDIPVGIVTQPGHVFARIPGYDVQTTSGRLVKADGRVKEVRDMMEEHKLNLNGFDSDRPYHETGDFGVLASIYGNTAIDEGVDKDFIQSTVNFLKAACLDPTQPNSGHAIELRFQKWFNIATANHDLVTARSIVNLCRQISRDPSTADKMAKRLVSTNGQLASR